MTDSSHCDCGMPHLGGTEHADECPVGIAEANPGLRTIRRPLELMDSGVATAPRLPADVRIAGRRQDFDLPVWRDDSGDIRIGLPKVGPEHAGDMDQLVLDVGDLLAAIGKALRR